MDLSKLPDIALRTIFSHLPLHDLIHSIPLVCHRWHSLQTGVLSRHSTSLTILVGKSKCNLYHEMIHNSNISIPYSDQLTNADGTQFFPKRFHVDCSYTVHLRKLSAQKQTNLFIKKFQNVIYLELCISVGSSSAIEAIQMIVRLLEHWSSGLKVLKIRCKFLSTQKSEKQFDFGHLFGRLNKTINKLPVLEHLTLDLRANQCLYLEPLNISILSRLHEFYFNSPDETNFLFDSLKRYAKSNDQLRSVGLGNSWSYAKFAEHFSNGKSSSSSLASRFTMLPNVGTLPRNRLNLDARAYFLATFNQLTSLKITMQCLTLAELTSTLEPLRQLVHLNLRFLYPIAEYETSNNNQITSLSTIKVLTLIVQTEAHNELESRHWFRMFPCVQILQIDHTSTVCHLCEYADLNTRYGPSLDWDYVAPCMKRTLLPFKQHFRRTLKKLYYWRNGDLNDVKEFTVEML